MHSSQDRNEPDEFESQLMAFVPQRSSIDRGVLLFRLGQESARPQHQSVQRALLVWRTATVALALLSTGLVWNTVRDDQPSIAQREQPISAVEGKASTTAPMPTVPAVVRMPRSQGGQLPSQHESPYLRSRSLVLASGLYAISDFSESYGSQRSDRATFQELRRVMFEF